MYKTFYYAGKKRRRNLLDLHVPASFMILYYMTVY